MIAAIILERNLQSVANYLILSLAVADLLVAVLVMPIGAIYEVNNINHKNTIYTNIILAQNICYSFSSNYCSLDKQRMDVWCNPM